MAEENSKTEKSCNLFELYIGFIFLINYSKTTVSITKGFKFKETISQSLRAEHMSKLSNFKPLKIHLHYLQAVVPTEKKEYV